MKGRPECLILHMRYCCIRNQKLGETTHPGKLCEKKISALIKLVAAQHHSSPLRPVRPVSLASHSAPFPIPHHNRQSNCMSETENIWPSPYGVSIPYLYWLVNSCAVHFHATRRMTMLPLSGQAHANLT